jgi:hypothetical protein
MSPSPRRNTAMRFFWLFSGLAFLSFSLGLIEPFAADVLGGRKIHYTSQLGHFGAGAMALLVVGASFVLAARRKLGKPTQDPIEPAQ